MDPNSKADASAPMLQHSVPNVDNGKGSVEQNHVFIKCPEKVSKAATPQADSGVPNDDGESKLFQLPETPGKSDLAAEKTADLIPMGRGDRGIKRSRWLSPHASPLTLAMKVGFDEEVPPLRSMKSEDTNAKKPKLFQPCRRRAESDKNEPLPAENQNSSPNTQWQEAIITLKQELEDLIQHTVITKLESLERSIDTLWRSNDRLVKKLSALNIEYEKYDRLEAVDGVGKNNMEIDPPDKQARQAVQTRTTFEPHPKIDSGKPTSTNPMMHVHPERIPGISNPKVQTQPSNLRREERNSQYPAEVNVKTPRDIAIKTEAFLSDFGLPLVAPDYLNVQIYSLVGNTPIASSYSTVVADGESLWLEIPESSINWKPFYRRQRTTSRQYWTANGVTLHQQLALETGRIPRRHKLAVRVHRDAPSSTLMKGKFCIHAHQIKIQVGDNSLQDWRKLRTNQLISQLKYTFGSLYHPRTSPDPKHENYPLIESNIQEGEPI